MTPRSIAAGVRETVRHPGLTIVSWLWTLALAALLALPAFALFSNALGSTREAGEALGAFNLRVLLEVFHYDRTSVVSLGAAAVAGLAVLAAVAGTFIAGGTVHVLVSRGRGPFLARFAEGGGRLFGRYLRLLVLTFVAGACVEMLAGFAAAPALTRLAGSSWEWGPIVATVASALLLAAVVGFFVLVLDYARIRIATTDQRSAIRNAYVALRYVLKHPLATFTIGVAAACALAVLLGGSLVLQVWMPSASWSSIAGVVIVQQTTMLLRAGVRVAQVASEVDLARRLPGLFPVDSADETGRDDLPAPAGRADADDALRPN